MYGPRFALISLLLVLASESFALDLNKAKKFINEKKPCRIVLAPIQNDQIPDDIYCAWDGIGNEGTVREFKGCFLGIYNLGTNKYRPLMSAGTAMIARSQPDGACNKELLKVILTKYSSSEWHQFGSGEPPVLTKLRKTNKELGIIYDEWGVITPDLLTFADTWKASGTKKKDKPINCSSATLTAEEEIKCLKPNEILARCKNLHPKGADLALYSATYKEKTGKELATCGDE